MLGPVYDVTIVQKEISELGLNCSLITGFVHFDSYEISQMGELFAVVFMDF